ncbi:MFS transporter [Usitatibacter palustris]|uniref:Enterobactin exporter EntS n=1 Tax=Usitatibacter palustris TaxID=2732487 RepID=A0A6M4H977_9PROT|nr:MFS transporter [Usitatibacter palustris]QJR14587.1 Enterobactin exporter EntS [Usitatibacter palustris]
MPLPTSLRALNSPNYRRYFIGQLVSMLGTWVQSVALMWLAYRISGSTSFTGLIGFLNAVPYLFLSPIAGVLGDRLPRRKILMVVLSLLMLNATALAILTGMHLITMPVLAGFALFSGLCNAFETPTRQSIFAQLLENREDLSNAIALNSMLMNGTRLVGPSIGGLIIAATNETVCFAINAVSYVAVIGALARTRVVHRRPPREPTRLLADLAEGWRFAMGFLPLRRMLFMLAVVSFSISPHATLMPAIAVKTFDSGAELVGLFIGAVGLGAVIAAISLARRPTIRGLARWIGIAAVIGGVGAIGFCFSREVFLSFVLMMMAGFGLFMVGATSNTIMQAIVDENMRSRVLSYYTMFFIGSAPLGHISAGYLAEHIGAPNTFLVGGIICLVAGAIFLWQMPAFRQHMRPVYVSRGIIPASPEPPQ